MIEQMAYTQRDCPSRPLPHTERARVLYRRARDRGRRSQFWSAVAGGSRRLLDLRSIEASCEVRARRFAGQSRVEIAQIRGSEGRAGDFDREFNPLRDTTRQRWLGIAAARERGKALPPVSLAQVGDIYFVQDGHHRISVARAYGQETIGARVVVWQVAGTLPWEAPGSRSGCEPTGQPGGAAPTIGTAPREGARLQDRVLQNARGLVAAVRLALRNPASG